LPLGPPTGRPADGRLRPGSGRAGDSGAPPATLPLSPRPEFSRLVAVHPCEPLAHLLPAPAAAAPHDGPRLPPLERRGAGRRAGGDEIPPIPPPTNPPGPSARVFPDHLEGVRGARPRRPIRRGGRLPPGRRSRHGLRSQVPRLQALAPG